MQFFRKRLAGGFQSWLLPSLFSFACFLFSLVDENE
jgi:hypothetical protein